MDQLSDSNKPNAIILNSAKVHISVIDAITEYMGNAELVEIGCSLLFNLSCNSTIEMDTTMGNGGLCELLPKVITAYINNADTLIVCYACMIVCNLAMTAELKLKLGDAGACELGDAGACELIVEVLKANISSETITAAACGAIKILAVNDTNTVKLGDAGACELVVEVLKAN
eukprot:4694-Heterococcus_DN1.PRE.1